MVTSLHGPELLAEQLESPVQKQWLAIAVPAIELLQCLHICIQLHYIPTVLPYSIGTVTCIYLHGYFAREPAEEVLLLHTEETGNGKCVYTQVNGALAEQGQHACKSCLCNTSACCANTQRNAMLSSLQHEVS